MDRRSMFYGARSKLFRKAFLLRENQTLAERILWTRLSKSQLLGYRFKRQHPIAHFVADFYCHKVRLVVEVDGVYHNRDEQKLYDSLRSDYFNSLGLKVLRFSDDEVILNPDKVIEIIKQHLPTN